MDFTTLIFAFFAGIFASAIGPLMTFVFCGIFGIVGVAAVAAGAQVDILGTFAFGIWFGPHVAFAGAVAALSYAQKRGYIESGRDITLPMMNMKKPDVLIVGGLFGAMGYVTNALVGMALPGKIDTIAASIVITSVLAKLLFDNSGLFGKVDEEDQKLGGRYSIFAKNNWVPYMATPPMLLTLALGIGGLSAYTVKMLLATSIAGLAAPLMFLICAVPLALFYVGLPVPVTHHIAIGAGYAVFASGGNLFWGFAGAIIGAFAGEFFARLWLVYGKTHIDPPACSVAVTSLLMLGILPALNFYEVDPMITPSVIVAAAVIYSVYSWGRLEKATESEAKAEAKAVAK
ncbi:hypothetical protein SANA_21070 [Gottschalkiaceae bacterium SANA]|nr:hypothetical protein SANA_21070 [Gottschalkiaceae bacterium SANA]